jgi:hypothetical protein
VYALYRFSHWWPEIWVCHLDVQQRAQLLSHGIIRELNPFRVAARSVLAHNSQHYIQLCVGTICSYRVVCVHNYFYSFFYYLILSKEVMNTYRCLTHLFIIEASLPFSDFGFDSKSPNERACSDTHNKYINTYQQ